MKLQKLLEIAHKKIKIQNMKRKFSCGEWHLDVTYMHAFLRKYPGQDARTSFEARVPFDAVATVEFVDDKAFISGMLSRSKPLSRKDRAAIESLLRQLGASIATAERGGEIVSIRSAKQNNAEND